ncbi:LysR family transcriptional regulator [Gryllotalpicola ginsengisoli]|uniref:LysR family transcriptional regulator n=1 Tax=Gryllotalpicola ginsengisoli TaxID=444608 RepID=UPI0003B56600|nr:LysR family transcriptional regulator [Gryllotalpicola ginsengisoli]
MTLVADDLPELDAQTLRIIGAIAEHGSITAAAAALGYSQPAISQHLRRAEQRLGLALAERVGRGVRLTEAGQVLARHARAVTTAFDAAAGELADLAGLRSGRVRLVGFPTASATVVPRLLQALTSAHPGLTVSYVEDEPPEAVEAVRAGTADLAVTFSYPGDRVDPHRDSAQGLAVEALWRDEMLAAVPSDHPVASCRAVPVRELAAAAWIAGCPRCRGHLLQVAQDADFAPRIAYETDNFAAVLGMVAAGIGVALVPQLALATTRVPEGVVLRPTTNRDRRTIHAVTTDGASKVPAIAAALHALAALDVAPLRLEKRRDAAR